MKSSPYARYANALPEERGEEKENILPFGLARV
jgi:hypothetical protein